MECYTFRTIIFLHRGRPEKITLEKKPLENQFMLCIENNGCEDIEKRKRYQILPDAEAAREDYLRVVDESQEDYLYPESYFVFVELPRKAQEAFVAVE